MLEKLKQIVIETVLYLIAITALIALKDIAAFSVFYPLSPLLITADIFIILILIPKRFYCKLLGRKESYNPWDSLYLVIAAVMIIVLDILLWKRYNEYISDSWSEHFIGQTVVLAFVLLLFRKLWHYR